MKWGSIFNSDYVNILFRAVAQNLKLKFRFICLTDNSDGLDEGVEALPIPHIGLTPSEVQAPGVWQKLALFDPRVAEISPGARALFIDLDMLILGELDHFFHAKEKIILLDTGRQWRVRDPVQPSTGVFAFTLGEQNHILQAFQSDRTGAILSFRNEQDFVAHHADGLSLWPKGVVISFKRHLANRFGRDLFREPRRPPTGEASILAFHGEPRPVELTRYGVWGRFPHIGLGPIGWAQDYWRKYGGVVPDLD